MQAAAIAILILIVAVVGLIVWLSKAQKSKVVAQEATKALQGAQEARNEADKVIAEPTADEDAWLAALNERLHNDNR